MSLSKESDDNEIFDTNIVFYNDNTKEKTTKLLEDELTQSSSSEIEFFDSIDSLHDNFDEKPNALNKEDHDNSVLTACLGSQTNSDAENSSLTKNISILSLDEKVNYNATEERLKNENSSTAEHLKKNKSSKYQSFPNIAVNKLNIIHPTRDISTISDCIKNLVDGQSEEKIALDEHHANLPTSIKQNKEINSNVEITAEHSQKPKRFKGFEETVDVLQNFLISAIQKKPTLGKSSSIDFRGGKYNKKAAPPPPAKSEQSATIKATLVLQPGVVKNLPPEGDNSCKELFIHSPKTKRRTSVNRSHSSLSSNSSASSSRTKQSFSKLINFPKKIGFWNRDELREKKSQQSFLEKNYLKSSLSDSKLQSNSENNLSKAEQNVNIPLHGTNVTRSGSFISIRSLTASPLVHKRLKIIRRYVDDDID